MSAADPGCENAREGTKTDAAIRGSRKIRGGQDADLRRQQCTAPRHPATNPGMELKRDRFSALKMEYEKIVGLGSAGASQSDSQARR